MAVRISARIWGEWQARADETSEPAIVLLFTSDLARKDALAALRRAGSEAIRELEREHPLAPGEDDFSTGHWSLAPVPKGVAVRIDEEPDDFEGLVRRIADGLEALGVEGDLDVYEPDVAAQVPDIVDFLDCRIRVAGERHHYRGPNWGWRADPTALAAAAAADAGVRWCVANATGLPLSLAVGLVAPARLDPGDDVHAYVREALDLTAQLGDVELTSAGPDRFRTLAVDASKGRVSLIEGGGSIATTGWQPSLRNLREALTAAAAWAVYGFVKRGSRRTDAVLGFSLAQDWVPISRFYADSFTADAFENELAPDALGVQLLGAGYAGRVPGGPDWRATTVGPDAVLVEHVDPEAWFDGSLVPFGGYRSTPSEDEVPVPDLVARARADFADILFTSDVAWGR